MLRKLAAGGCRLPGCADRSRAVAHGVHGTHLHKAASAAARHRAAPARRRAPRLAAAPSSSAAAAAEAASAAAAATGPLQKDAKQLTQLLSQLARLGVRPHAEWLEEALAAVRTQADTLGPEEITGTMRALAAWGWQPEGALLEALEGRALRGIAGGAFDAKRMSELAWSYAQLALKRRTILSAILEASEAELRAGTCPPGAMADLLWAMARLQHPPASGRWLPAFFEASAPRLREFDSQQMARALWALARLEAPPPAAWLDAFFAASLGSLRGFDVKATSLTLWALATLKASPPAAWLRAFEGSAEAGVRQLGAAEAATALWALSQLTGKPPQELRLSAALRRPQKGLSQLDFELLADIRMLRVVKSMITGGPAAGSS